MSTKSRRTATRRAVRATAKGATRRPSKARPVPKAEAQPAEPSATKQSQLIAMLRTPAGGTMEQLTELTGWQPHTVRGTISGTLRKRLKLNVICVERVYRIAEAQA